jgi:hypothetical protein
MMCNPLKKTISPVLMTRPRMRPLQTQKVFRQLRTTRARAMCRQEWLQPLQPLLQVQQAQDWRALRWLLQLVKAYRPAMNPDRQL